MDGRRRSTVDSVESMFLGTKIGLFGQFELGTSAHDRHSQGTSSKLQGMFRLRILPEKELREGQTAKFTFSREGVTIEGFLVRFGGRVMGYENVCRHIPITIDYGDNQFFTQDGTQIICQTHGAIYDPTTGKCMRGPCQGASLFRLQIEIKEGAIWLTSTDRIEGQ